MAYNTKAGDSLFFISGMPIFLNMGKHWLVPKSCLKDGGVPKSPELSLNLGDETGVRRQRFELAI